MSQNSKNRVKGKPSDPAVLEKRETVKNMMIHAWKGYHEKAWSENEVRPISGKGHSANIFGNAKTGATIVDALGLLFSVTVVTSNQLRCKALDRWINLLVLLALLLVEILLVQLNICLMLRKWTIASRDTTVTSVTNSSLKCDLVSKFGFTLNCGYLVWSNFQLVVFSWRFQLKKIHFG